MRAFLLSFLVFASGLSFGQKNKLKKIASLPYQINESSGLALADSNLLWTMNDGGGGSALFLLTKKGELNKTLLLNNSSNHDWEDLASDSASIFIGDFGNNNNLRNDLLIYRIKKEMAKDSGYFIPQTISFSYSDQKEFPPPPSNWNFDCEAFFYHKGFLYLFSKNLSNPSDGYTKLYRLPADTGKYVAALIDSFLLNEPVAGAAISPDGKSIVLLTYFSLFIFRDFSDSNFFSGKTYQFALKGFSQKEAICFANDHELFVTDEKHFGKGGKLYEVDLTQLDFSHPTVKYRKQFFKRAIYNSFNNPKAKYKKIMKREAAQ